MRKNKLVLTILFIKDKINLKEKQNKENEVGNIHEAFSAIHSTNEVKC